MRRRVSGDRILLPWQRLWTESAAAVVVLVDVETGGRWRGQMGGWAFVGGIGVALLHLRWG